MTLSENSLEYIPEDSEVYQTEVSELELLEEQTAYSVSETNIYNNLSELTIDYGVTVVLLLGAILGAILCCLLFRGN